MSQKLNKNQRKMLQIGVLLILAIFLVYYLFLRKENRINTVHNNAVTLKDSKLQVFDDTYALKPYPDRVLMHYPYFLVIQADKPLTTIYNLETRQKEKEVKDILLDYYQGDSVYNRKQTYFNDINLDKYCDSAFIKSKEEVLCTYRSNQDSHNNVLISIPVKHPNLWGMVYQSDTYNILTAVSVINNNLYIGEINFNTKQNYLTINKKTIPVDNIVSMIYQIQGKPYFASFKSTLNKNKESYYQITESEISIIKEGKIVLY